MRGRGEPDIVVFPDCKPSEDIIRKLTQTVPIGPK